MFCVVKGMFDVHLVDKRFKRLGVRTSFGTLSELPSTVYYNCHHPIFFIYIPLILFYSAVPQDHFQLSGNRFARVK